MASAVQSREDEDWELYNDNGFVFKRKKRCRLQFPHPSSSSDADQCLDAARKHRKTKILLKLKTRYLTEIHHWDFLSSTLRAMEVTALEFRRQQEQATPLPLDPVAKSVVDDVLLQMQTQEAIVHKISNLCEEAEAMCYKLEQQFKQSVFDIPIWVSPAELMQYLCLSDD